MFQLPANFLSQFLVSQFAHLPYPEGDFTGQTVIVTGANVGLGLEAARHFVRLKAGLVILACRDVRKGELAKADIRLTTPENTQTAIEVWEVDMCSFASVRNFCNRAQTLSRLDIVVENAGIATGNFVLVEGFESTMTVNVISTFLMALLLLNKLRETTMKFNTVSHLTIVSSDAHQMANFRERNEPDIFAALSDPTSPYQSDRYNVSKLIELLMVRELGPILTASAQSGKPAIILNAINPAYCKSALQRNAPIWLKTLSGIGQLAIARKTEVGSRTLFAGAIAAEESHGKYMHDCKVWEPSAFVRSEEGMRTQTEVYRQLMAVLEGIQPGITEDI